MHGKNFLNLFYVRYCRNLCTCKSGGRARDSCCNCVLLRCVLGDVRARGGVGALADVKAGSSEDFGGRLAVCMVSSVRRVKQLTRSQCLRMLSWMRKATIPILGPPEIGTVCICATVLAAERDVKGV